MRLSRLKHSGNVVPTRGTEPVALLGQRGSEPAWSYSSLIVGYPDHVKLMIWRGTDLRDPKAALRGTGSNTRHLRFDRPADIESAVVRGLITQQLQLFASGVPYEKAARRRAPRALPPDVRRALRARGLTRALRARPAYQQTDYIAWIEGAKRETTRTGRLEQMLAELEAGDVYMKMPWQVSGRKTPAVRRTAR
jgi:uncharacterized protein YdeI (YjbR/CyaY-like superfamily)